MHARGNLIEFNEVHDCLKLLHDGESLLQEQRARNKTALADHHSLAADPLFVDPVHGDFSFKNESSALKLGIQPLSVDIVRKMGTLRDPFLARFTPDSSTFFKHGERGRQAKE
jgi:hypothetical protein